MTKVKLQTPKHYRARKGMKGMKKAKSRLNPVSHFFGLPTTKREIILTKQLKDLGKLGGVIDKRVGVNDPSVSSSDAALRRHIIEKLRQMETLGTIAARDDDPLLRAAVGDVKPTKHASFDDELGGLSADIVESELFAGGVLTPDDQPSNTRQNKHDKLMEKIAQTKEERLRRVEENEANRQKLKDADSEWTNKIRLMLAKISELKPLNKKAAKKMDKGRSEVLRLLKSFSSSKTIAPVGAKVETEATKNDRLIAHLESIIVKRAGEVSESKDASEQSKTEDLLLRLLCRIRTYESTIVGRIAEELQSLVVSQLSDVVRGLLLSQILLTEVVSRKVEDEGKSNTKFRDHTHLNGIFVPEIVHFLLRLIGESTREDGILFVSDDASHVDSSLFENLDIRVALRQRPLLENEVAICRLGCLDRCLTLISSLIDIYTAHFPAPVICQIFSDLSLDRLNTDCLPVNIEMKVRELSRKMAEVRSQPRPKDIVSIDRVSLVLADKNVTMQAFQKAGLVPQMEPEFEEKLDARRIRKKRPTNVELRQKLAKERRGIVRELRRDARFLANYDRKKIKAGDEERKRKTQAIIASMRSIE